MTEKEELLNEESTNTSAQTEASTEATTEATVEQAETTSTEEPRELTVEEKLAEAEAKIEKLNNAMLYKVAEFEKQFIQMLHVKHQADVLDLIREGQLTDEIEAKITAVANEIASRY